MYYKWLFVVVLEFMHIFIDKIQLRTVQIHNYIDTVYVINIWDLSNKQFGPYRTCPVKLFATPVPQRPKAALTAMLGTANRGLISPAIFTGA